MLCSGQEDKGEISHHTSLHERSSQLCSHWCLESYQDCIT